MDYIPGSEECCWIQGRSIDEDLFCQEFLLTHELVFTGGHFYTPKGVITDESSLRKEIYDMLAPRLRVGIAKKVEAIMAALRLAARKEVELDNPDLIHLANGTFDIYNWFRPDLQFCRHRLPVSYTGKSDKSQVWENFLQALLEPEDILTLQEFMGYCLLPTNRAQKMLMILGNGGEGKSRIGVVMKAIFGEAMNVGSLSKLEASPFARADLENKLVMVDDDLRMDALRSTNYLKSLITADVAMDVEKKFEQSYQAKVYTRFIAFGNGSLEALHDRSHGFYRRQIILTAKPRDPDRVDDPYLGEKLVQDKDKIFIWCLLGLCRLIEQDFQFTLSEKARQNWHNAVASQNNAVDFMNSQGYFRYDSQGTITARRLYDLYSVWCADNALKPLSQRAFSTYLISNEAKLHIQYSSNVPAPEGKRARGFLGLAADVQLSVYHGQTG